MMDCRGGIKTALKSQKSALLDSHSQLMSLKAIGNIGAHPERDISMVVDVEPGEVDELIELLRILDGDWYVARAARIDRLAKVKKLGEEKAIAASTTTEALPVPRAEG